MGRRKRSTGLGILGNVFEVSDRRHRQRGLVRLAPGVGRVRRKRKKEPQMTDYFNLANRLGLGSGRRRRKSGGLANRAAQAWTDRLTPTEKAEIRREIDEAVEDDPETQAVKADYKLRQSSSWWYRIVYLITKRFRKPVL
ncbi:hypothetical protein BECAL_02298 [Bellilinea caldifistulae]|uniref:Uncharacterized protein n=1 Tax=Bellilinea caldifistulae TaxID=360411 RepID=A0A0N8GLZ0_9CHLR|nr:hypothetical protein AC812_13675 [Bellilinea caldifistulae]GAP11113.1 hypothetical protein BECAL_02298 [Bellilinea caldifistulae]